MLCSKGFQVQISLTIYYIYLNISLARSDRLDTCPSTRIIPGLSKSSSAWPSLIEARALHNNQWVGHELAWPAYLYLICVGSFFCCDLRFGLQGLSLLVDLIASICASDIFLASQLSYLGLNFYLLYFARLFNVFRFQVGFLLKFGL